MRGNNKPQPTPSNNKEESLNLSEKQIKKAFEKLVQKKLSEEQKTKFKSYEDLDRIIGEFMDCCIVMGYDTNGEGVVRMIHNNNMQHDALCNLLQKVVASQFGSGPFNSIP